MADTSSAAKADTSGLSGRELIQRARVQLEQMMGRPVEAVLGLQPHDDGWWVTVQVVELQRVPATTDVLGSYEVTVDADGNVVAYRRTRRYYRNQADEG